MQHLADQQAGNHRGQVQLNDSFYQYTLHQQCQYPNPYSWPTPDQFRATVAWPGDRPNFQEGVGPIEAQGDEDGTEEDRDMENKEREGDCDRECSSSRHRSERERDGERKDRDKDRERRDKDKDRRDRDRDREHERREKDRERERERAERERSTWSRSRSERDRDREQDFDMRDGRRFRDKKEAAEPEADPERDQRTVFAYQMPLKATERDVYEFFSKAGKVSCF
eukprot:XP_025985208.1 DEAD-box ATP-dependent RNA helicase 42-like [Glycine max]